MTCRPYAALAGVFCIIGVIAHAQPPAKHPVPNLSEQQVKAAEIGEIFKAEYDQAKSIEQKIALAKKLIEQSVKTKDDPVGRFTLLRVGRDLSAKNGDLVSAFDAVRALEADYSIDTLAMKHDAVRAASALPPRNPRELYHLRELTASTVVQAVAEDQFDVAKSLLKAVTPKSPEAAFLKELTLRGKEVAEQQANYQKIATALEKLKSQPTDAESNLAVGRYYCLSKGQWSKGVPLLALGDEPTLQSAALLEMAPKPDALKLGDAWWDIAAKEEGLAKKWTQAHAAAWYWKAIPAVTGLTKSRIETRAAGVIPIPYSEDAWAHLLLSNAQIRGDYVYVPRGELLQTVKEFSGPVEVVAVVRTYNNDFRLFGPRGASIIFNWADNPEDLRVTRPDGGENIGSGSLVTAKVSRFTPMIWHRLTWRMSSQGMQILANDQPIFTERRPLDLSKASRYQLGVLIQDPIEVREFYVRNVPEPSK